MASELSEREVLRVVAELCRERTSFDPGEIQYAAWDLDDDMLGTLNLANTILIRMGYVPLEIFSGRRSCAEQRALRPAAARQSWHPVGRAIDATGDADDVAAFRFVWTLLGGRAGVNFRDPSPEHYDLPYRGGLLAPPCW